MLVADILVLVVLHTATAGPAQHVHEALVLCLL